MAVSVVTWWTQGVAWRDPGCRATDNYDGDLTARVQVAGAVDWRRRGDYTLTYMVADSSGNTAVATRLVKVRPSWWPRWLG